MKQTDLGLNMTTKRTCERDFLAQMERVEYITGLGMLALAVALYARGGLLGGATGKA